MTKTILFTFDYELFLGARPITSGTVENCLLKPTNWILEVFELYEVKHAIFFIDTLYIYKLYRLQNSFKKIKEDLHRIKCQINSIIKKGHYIAPHIHPHWLEAEYLEEFNQWDLSKLDKYRFEDLNDIERNNVFKNTFFILNEFLGIKSNSIDIYRAGGYCIEPFSSFKQYFDEYQITNDFSAIVNECFVSNYAKFDFTSIKKAKPYKFQDSVVEPATKGKYIEYPISKYRYSFIPYMKTKLYNEIDKLRKYDNTIIGLIETLPLQLKSKHEKTKLSKAIKQTLIYKILKYLKLIRGYEGGIMSIENLNPDTYYHYINALKKGRYNHFITHPKGISLQNQKTFEMLLQYMSKNFPKINYDYNEISV